jgi:hypothetical protein
MVGWRVYAVDVSGDAFNGRVAGSTDQRVGFSHLAVLGFIPVNASGAPFNGRVASASDRRIRPHS